MPIAWGLALKRPGLELIWLEELAEQLLLLQMQNKTLGCSKVPGQLKLGEDSGTLPEHYPSQKKFWMNNCSMVLVATPVQGL